jgi:DNA-3-methyladenine glycosylase I
VRYHDEEWGVPSHDEAHLFEMLILEGAQAGLSWATILKKREAYRAAFDGFDPEKMARYTPKKIEKLLADPGIVRNRLKVRAAVNNAQAYLTLRDERGGLAPYLWDFVDGEPVVNRFRTLSEVPAQTPVSEAISRDLKKRGFRFVGPTICYAYMQSVGLVNDHLISCPSHPDKR